MIIVLEENPKTFKLFINLLLLPFYLFALLFVISFFIRIFGE